MHQKSKWTEKSSCRYHHHDVTSLCIDEVNECVVIGGVDTRITCQSLKEKSFEGRKHYSTVHLPSHKSIHVAHKSRMLLFQSNQFVELYCLSNGVDQLSGFMEGDKIASDYSPIFQLRNKEREHIMSSAISPEGNFLSFSTLNKLSVFRFELINGVTVNLKSVGSELLSNCSAMCMHFSKNAQGQNFLVFTNEKAQLHFFDLENEKMEKVLELNLLVEASGNFKDHLGTTVKQMGVSSDGKWLFVCDISGNVLVFDFGTYELYYKLTGEPEKELLHVSFNPHAQPNLLFLCFAPLSIMILDLSSKQFLPWKAGPNVSRALLNFKHVVTGLAFNPAFPEKLYWYGFEGFMGSLNFSPDHMDQGCNLKVTGLESEIYQGILDLTFLGPNEFSLITRSWSEIVKDFPPSLERITYRTA